jgi:hypothetical protein
MIATHSGASLAWASQQLRHADFGHQARNTRAIAMLAQMAETPAGTVAGTFAQPAARKGAYAWLENPEVTYEQISEALHQRCAQRCRDHAMVIVPIDGSSIAHTDTHKTHGVGPIGSRAHGARGIKTFTAVALTYDGVPLGIAAHTLWARSDTPAQVEHPKRDLQDKESRHWTALQQQFEHRLAEENAQCIPWYQLDREGCATHVLLRGLCLTPRFTVRCSQDRLLDSKSAPQEHAKLYDALHAAPACGVMYLLVPRGKNRVERIARLEVRVVPVSLQLQAQWTKKKLGNVGLTAVRVLEVDTVPAGEEPLDWVLLTNCPTQNFDDAVRVVRAYSLRWMVERVHYTWKSGTCRAEDSQLESFSALAKWMTLHLSVAVHRQELLHLSRTQPDLPSDEHFDRDEIDAALTLYTQHRKDGPRPGSVPSLGTLVDIIARLGGYGGKSSGGPPGIAVFQRGLDRVETLALGFKLQRELAAPHTADDKSG